MGSNDDHFITLAKAAEVLGRTPKDVNNLCNEGLIRRRSTGEEILVHQGDLEDVKETCIHSIARPKDLIKDVLLLKREVASLRETVDLLGKVNGFLSSSLRRMDEGQLLQLSEVASQFLKKPRYTLEELLQFSEIFLTIADSDIVRLNDTMGKHDTWRVFYELCLRMVQFSRDGTIPNGRDLETAQVLLDRGLRNLRSIGVLFIENEAFLKSSKELLEEAMGHDLAGFDTLMRQLKSNESVSWVKNQ